MINLKRILSVIILVNSFAIFGQDKNTFEDIKLTPSQLLYKSLEKYEKNPIILINGVVSDNVNLSNIDPNNILKIEIFKDEEAIKLYGEVAKNGVIVITLKYGVKLSSTKKRHPKNEKRVKITGTIYNSKEKSLSGVVISNLNEKEAFYSDLNGEYSLSAYKNDLLVYSLEGYDSRKTTVEKAGKVNIILGGIDNRIKMGDITIKKPIIYLYPTQKTDIKIDLEFKGKLLTSFPKYDNNWSVTAYPDGRIFDNKTNRFYSSLFWDGMRNFTKEHYNYPSGFVVSKNDLTNFLIEKLENIGLNNYETNEFIQYWLPILEQNETNFIHFYVNADYDIISKNNVFPKPDTSIRIFMEFYALDKSIEISEQRFSKTERKGFTLVEWGGSDVSNAVNEMKILKL